MWAKLNLVYAWTADTASSPDFWKALVAFGTSLGLVITPEQSNAIIAAGLALMGLIHSYNHVTR
jgi:hypothetical protein